MRKLVITLMLVGVMVMGTIVPVFGQGIPPGVPLRAIGSGNIVCVPPNIVDTLLATGQFEEDPRVVECII